MRAARATRVTRPGLAPHVWQAALRRRPPLRLPRSMRGTDVLVVAAHADDETLGAGGILQTMHRRGARFRMVVATDGAAAFPGLEPELRAELARTREQEAHSALRELGLGSVEVHFLGLPDGAALGHQAELQGALGDLGAGCAYWVAPWRDDPHPDHRAAGLAAAAGHGGSALLEYPIWMRHSVTPRDPRITDRSMGGPLQVWRPTRGQQARKARAIAAHQSQITSWAEGFEPILPGYVLALFDGTAEPVFVSGAGQEAA